MRYREVVDGSALPELFTLQDLPKNYTNAEYKISEDQARQLECLLNPNWHRVERAGLGYRIKVLEGIPELRART